MASINGITIKNLKNFVSQEGDICYQGNVYIENKKVGFWSQDDWGGADRFEFVSPFSENLLQERVKDLNPDKGIHGIDWNNEPFILHYSLERLMYDLKNLMKEEKAFKMSVKDGYGGIMILTDGCRSVTWNLNKELLKLSNENLVAYFSQMIEDAKVKANFREESVVVKHKVKIYRSLDDFNIGTAISLKEISMATSIDEKMKQALHTLREQSSDTPKMSLDENNAEISKKRKEIKERYE